MRQASKQLGIFGVLVTIALFGASVGSMAQKRSATRSPATAAAPKPAATPTPNAATLVAVKALKDQAAEAISKNDRAGAIKLYDAAIELTPNDAELYMLRGRQQNWLKQYDVAIASLDEAIRLNPNYAIAFYERASVYSFKDLWSNTLKDTEQAVRLDPDFADAWALRQTARRRVDFFALPKPLQEEVFANANLADDSVAVERLSGVIAQVPGVAFIYARRGERYYRLGKMVEARADLERAIALDPFAATPWRILGYIESDKDNYGGAIAFLSRAIALNPDEAMSWVDRGVYYSNIGDYSSAVADFDRAIKGFATDQSIPASKKEGIIALRDQTNQKNVAAIAAATPPSMKPSVVAAGSRSCQDIINDFGTYVGAPAANPFAVSGWDQRYSVGQQDEQAIWSFREYLRLNDALPVCRSDTAGRQMLSDTLERTQGYCRSHNGGDCVNGAYYGTAAGLQDERAAFDRLLGENTKTVVPAALSANNIAERNCYNQTGEVRKKLDAFNRSAATASAVTTLEALMWSTRETMRIIDSVCPSAPSYIPIRKTLPDTYAQAEKACNAVAANGPCLPRIPAIKEN